MDEDIETASKFETYGVKLFNAATIAAVAYLVLFVDISGRGRGIDVLKGLVGSSTAASGPTLSKPHVVVVNGLEADSSRMMVTPEQGPATQASVERQRGPTAAELAAGVAPVGGAKEDSRRLKGSLESIGGVRHRFRRRHSTLRGPSQQRPRPTKRPLTAAGPMPPSPPPMPPPTPAAPARKPATVRPAATT